MTDKKWEDIKRVMKRDHQVLSHEMIDEEGGSVHKEVFVVQGKRGITRFTRITRQQIYEDPMDWSNPDDWSLSGYNIVSRVEVERQNPDTQVWELLDINQIIK